MITMDPVASQATSFVVVGALAARVLSLVFRIILRKFSLECGMRV